MNHSSPVEHMWQYGYDGATLHSRRIRGAKEEVFFIHPEISGVYRTTLYFFVSARFLVVMVVLVCVRVPHGKSMTIDERRDG